VQVPAAETDVLSRAALPAAAAPDVARVRLRGFVVAAGIAAAVLFLVVAWHYQLQTYGDGSLFSYAVAVEDAWAFHWHNIAARSSVLLYALLPAELYVGLTGDARGGIDLYGLLFYAAPLIGLGATFAADRSGGRVIFTAACLSTACVCPLVFGFPTELWLAHALFWPTLAACHYARGPAALPCVLALLLALAFTHEGALVFIAAILASLVLCGPRDPLFLRACGCCVVVLAAWIAVKRVFPPDDYYAPILARAAFYLIDLRPLGAGVFGPLYAALGGYALLALALRRLGPARASAIAAVGVALGLAVYWWRFDESLHAESRYAARTALLIATPALGGLAASFALAAEGRLALTLLRPVLALLARCASPPALAGAIALVMLVHVVETAKFVDGWVEYRAALAALASGAESDPGLGDPQFVSAARLGPALNRLGWNSTTPFLSVLVAPGLVPARLVVDPNANYFWLTCESATASAAGPGAIPRASRELVRRHACLHR
jgi:hypothetical protein